MTKDQYERIKTDSRNKGFSSLSSYLRYIALEQDMTLRHKIYEIHQHIVPDAGNRKYKNNARIAARL